MYRHHLHSKAKPPAQQPYCTTTQSMQEQLHASWVQVTRSSAQIRHRPVL
jgi:hypothetical protein